mmetsp:Transcript_17005/g.40975  ORF Transcript_17005/g.40975 Transcript_17005/m.40975 type:complete len:126 (-) Transcript_17005:20-397(-)
MVRLSASWHLPDFLAPTTWNPTRRNAYLVANKATSSATSTPHWLDNWADDVAAVATPEEPDPVDELDPDAEEEPELFHPMAVMGISAATRMYSKFTKAAPTAAARTRENMARASLGTCLEQRMTT